MSAKPIIPWMGGKRRLVDRILPLIPPHSCYVELFAGGAALFFMRPQLAEHNVINDINGELVNLYRVVQNHLPEFFRQFSWSLSSRQGFEWFQVMKPEALTDIQRATRFFFLQHHAFGGKVEGQSFGTATSGGPSLNLNAVEDLLRSAHLRLSQATIEHESWRQCMARYDRPHTFFYLDPPYWQTAGYGAPFQWSEYEAIAAAFKTLKGKAILSINDHPEIRACFADFQMESTGINYTVGGAGTGEGRSELLIFSWDRLVEPFSLF